MKALIFVPFLAIVLVPMYSILFNKIKQVLSTIFAAIVASAFIYFMYVAMALFDLLS